MLNRSSQERKKLRLRDHDYSESGGYFVTICTHQKEQFLCEIEGNTVKLSPYGCIANDCWLDLPNHYADVEMDHFVIMPNHIHGILVLVDSQSGSSSEARIVGDGFETVPYTPKRHTLSEIIRGFKTYSARAINQLRQSKGAPVWQRSFYDHIIRNDADYNRICEYILYNPNHWNDDEYFD